MRPSNYFLEVGLEGRLAVEHSHGGNRRAASTLLGAAVPEHIAAINVLPPDRAATIADYVAGQGRVL